MEKAGSAKASCFSPFHWNEINAPENNVAETRTLNACHYLLRENVLVGYQADGYARSVVKFDVAAAGGKRSRRHVDILQAAAHCNGLVSSARIINALSCFPRRHGLILG